MADEQEVLAMTNDSSIGMKPPHRTVFIKAWKARIEAAAALPRGKAAAARREEEEKLRKLLGEFGLSNEDELRKIDAEDIKTVADLALLEPEDVEVLGMSLVSGKKFTKMLEHVGAPAFLAAAAKKKQQAEMEAAAAFQPAAAAAATEQKRKEEKKGGKAAAAAAAEAAAEEARRVIV